MVTALVASLSRLSTASPTSWAGSPPAKTRHSGSPSPLSSSGLRCSSASRSCLPPASWSDPRILWGLGAGIFGGGGVLALYAGLATGRMSVVGPIAAALTGALPAAVGLSTGAPLRWTGLLGMALALVSVVIVSMFAEDEEAAVSTGSPRTAIAFAVAAGLGFGISVICFSQTPASTSFAPLVLARSTTVTVLLVISIVRGGRVMPTRDAGRIALFTGVVDAGRTSARSSRSASVPWRSRPSSARCTRWSPCCSRESSCTSTFVAGSAWGS